MKSFASWICALSLVSSVALANPSDGTVVSGSATIQQAGKVTTVTTTSGKTILNWNGFSIGPGELTKFVQPSQLSAVLNRVTGLAPSVIQGALRSNGRVFLLNPNGILFSPSAQVDVGSLVASTLSMTDQDFLNDNYRLFQDEDHALSYVINQGRLTAADHGSVILVAPLVDNEGVIVANLGSVQLAAGTRAYLDPSGLVSLDLSAAGDVKTDGPTDLLAAVVNHGGILPAGSLQGNVLRGASGLAVNGGTLQGDTIVVDSGTATVLAPGSLAQATGSVQALSQGNTIFSPGSQLTAPFVEVSGLGNVVIQGQVTAETFLIDPADLTIIDGSGGDQDGNLPDIFFGDANTALNTVSEQALEAQTSNVVLEASNSITVNDLSDGELTMANNVSLTMTAIGGNLTFSDPTNTVVTSGTGTITLNAGGTADLGNLTSASGVTVASDGSMTLQSIDAGTGAVKLTTLGSVVDGNLGGTNVKAGSLELQAGGTVLSLETEVDRLAMLADGHLEVTNSGPSLLAVAAIGGTTGVTSTHGNVSLTNNFGGIDLGDASLGSNPAVQAQGEVQLYGSDGSLVGDADDGAPDVVGQRVSLYFPLADVGTLSGPIETRAATLFSNAQGAVVVREADDLTLDGAQATDLVVSSAGNLFIANPLTATNQVSLTAQGGTIKTAFESSATWVDAPKLTLQASGEINVWGMKVDSFAATGSAVLIDLDFRMSEPTIDRLTNLTNGAVLTGIHSTGDALINGASFVSLGGAGLGTQAAITAGNTVSFVGISHVDGDTDDGAPDIIAPNLTVDHGNLGYFQPVETSIDFFAADFGSNGVKMIESDGLTIAQVSAAFGFRFQGPLQAPEITGVTNAATTISIRVEQGDLRLDGPGLGTNPALMGNNVSLEVPNGRIFGDSDDTSPDIVGYFGQTVLLLQAGTAVGSAAVPIETRTDRLAASAGQVFLNEQDGVVIDQEVSSLPGALVVTGLRGTAGAVALTTSSGDIDLSAANLGSNPAVQATGRATLKAGGAILADTDAAADIVGASSILLAGSSIGTSSSRIELAVGTLAASGAGVFLHDDISVTLDSLTTPSGQVVAGVNSSADAILDVGGSGFDENLSLAGANLGASPALTVGGFGNVQLYGLGSLIGDTDDVAADITGNAVVVYPMNGNVGSMAAPVETQLTNSFGFVTLNSPGSAYVHGLGDSNISGGGLTNIAITVTNGNLTGGASASNSVSLYVPSGDIFSGSGTYDVKADKVILQAGGFIGAPTDPYVYDTSRLAASAANINLEQNGVLTPTVDGLTSLASGAVVAGVSATGSLRLAADGHLNLNGAGLGSSPAVAAGGIAVLEAGGTIQGDTDDLSPDIISPQLLLDSLEAGVPGASIEFTSDTLAGSMDSFVNLVSSHVVTIDALTSPYSANAGPGVSATGLLGGSATLQLVVTSGNLRLNGAGLGTSPAVSANRVTLQTLNGSIIGDTDDSSPDISSRELILRTSQAVGNATVPVELSAPKLAAQVGSMTVNDNVAVVASKLSDDFGNTQTGIVSTTGALSLTSTGNIDLSSATLGTAPAIQAATSLTLTTPGQLVAGADANNDLVASTMTLSTGTGNSGLLRLDATNLTANVSGVGALNLTDNTGGLTVTSAQTTNGAISIASSGGTLTLASLTAGGAGRSITASSNSDLLVANATASGDTITLTAGGKLDESNPDAGADLTGTNLVLSAGSGVGRLEANASNLTADVTGTGDLELTRLAGNLNVTHAATANGKVDLLADAGRLTATDIQANGDVLLTTTTSGNVAVGSVSAPGRVVTLTSAAQVVDADSDAATDLVAKRLNVAAVGAVGPLQIDVSNLDAQGSSLDLADASGGLNVLNAIAPSVSLSTVGGLMAQNVEATGNVALSATGNVSVGRVSTPTGNIAITAGGVINEFGADPDADLKSATLSLQSATGIGTGGAVETAVGSASASVSGAGSINLAETTGGLTLDSASTTNGGITITSADGPLKVTAMNAAGPVSLSTTGSGDIRVAQITASGAVQITSAGSILELTPDAGVDLIAGANSVLRANGGYLSPADALEVNITGSLSVLATGQIAGVSVRIDGTVSPTNTLIRLNTPPGQVLFNGVVVP